MTQFISDQSFCRAASPRLWAKMGDTWDEVVALRNKKSSLREKLAKRKKEREELLEDALGTGNSTSGKNRYCLIPKNTRLRPSNISKTYLRRKMYVKYFR